MNCKEVQAALAYYLDDEIPARERADIQKHLNSCITCRGEFEALNNTSKSLGRELQSLARHAEPSPQAWEQLQARLKKETPPFKGDSIMKKRIVLPAFAAVAILTLVVIFISQNVSSVSAQQILDRASAAQAAEQTSQGIHHMLIESYYNMQALPGENAGTRTISESYLDLESGHFRNVTTNADGSKVLDAFGFDGSYTYSTRGPIEASAPDPLTIYRSPQSQAATGDMTATGSLDSEQIFNLMRSDPQVKLEKKDTWFDGRTVYVVVSDRPVKFIARDDTQVSQGSTMAVFDSKTYQLLESRTTLKKDGQDVLIASTRYLANEILPAGSPVAWDMNDLKGVTFVEDPDRQMGDLLPEVISAQDLAAHTTDGYLLQHIPEGYNLEITAPPRQDNETMYIYIASYRNENDDIFVIQHSGDSGFQAEDSDETYTTATGLVLEFMKAIGSSPDGKVFQSINVKTPGGTAFMINSNLDREKLKSLAEDLAPVK